MPHEQFTNHFVSITLQAMNSTAIIKTYYNLAIFSTLHLFAKLTKQLIIYKGYKVLIKMLTP